MIDSEVVPPPIDKQDHNQVCNNSALRHLDIFKVDYLSFKERAREIVLGE